MLSDEAFIGALLEIVNGFFTFVLGLFFIFQGRKTNAKLLSYFGLGVVGISVSSGLSTFIDFITIIMTGDNMNGYLKLYITWGPVPFTAVLLHYVFIRILIPKKKWYLLSLILTLNILYFLDLYMFHWTSDVIVYPATPGEDLLWVHHAVAELGQIFPFRWSVFSYSLGIIYGVGLLYKALWIKGIFRKKYIYLSINQFLFNLSGFLRYQMILLFGYIAGIFFTIIAIISLVLVYLGLRAEPEERKKKVKKKIKTKDSLFRIIERPEQITDEEVAFYREQKICLMCKGKVTGFNIFICPNCDALYHEDCARALSSMENACWVCIEPIDKTKPTKPFKKVEEKKDVEEKENKKLNQH